MNIYVSEFKKQPNLAQYSVDEVRKYAWWWPNTGKIYVRGFGTSGEIEIFDKDGFSWDLWLDEDGFFYSQTIVQSFIVRVNNRQGFPTDRKQSTWYSDGDHIYQKGEHNEYHYRVCYTVPTYSSDYGPTERPDDGIRIIDVYDSSNLLQLTIGLLREANTSVHPSAWWASLNTGTTIKKGTIMSIVNDDGRVAYVVAKESYTIKGDTKSIINGNGVLTSSGVQYNIKPNETSDFVHLHFGVNAYNGYDLVNVISDGLPSLPGSYGYNTELEYYKNITNPSLGKDTGASIWETCTPGDSWALGIPWTFETKAVITDYIALQWYDKYNDAGVFSLTLPINDDNIEALKVGRYLMIEKSNKIMIIEGLKTNANLMADGYIMQVTGRSLESILDRRVAFPAYGLDTIICKGDKGLIKGLYSLFNAYFINPEQTAKRSSDGKQFFYYPERKIEFFDQYNTSVDTPGLIKRPFNASINKTIIKDDLLKAISETCQNNELGFRIVADRRFDSRQIVWRFELYTGEDRSYYRQDKSKSAIVFSPILNNVKALSVNEDNTNYKNAIFCGVDKESDAYIDLTTIVNPSDEFNKVINMVAQPFGLEETDMVKGIRSKVSEIFSDLVQTYTGIFYLVIAGADSSSSYTPTIKSIKIKFTENYPRSYWTGLGITFSQSTEYEGIWGSGYPIDPISREAASCIEVTAYIRLSEDDSSNKTIKFLCSDYSEKSQSVANDDNYFSFKNSTAYGWLLSKILITATDAAKTYIRYDDYGANVIVGWASSWKKSNLMNWLSNLDNYTSNKSLIKWLCQLYLRNNDVGIDRREVFVDEINDDDNDWDASSIAAWRQNTETIKVNNYEDEESDEEVNQRLLESARKQSAAYDKVRSVDVDVDTTDMKYLVDYDLGDIVQVDDGIGNCETYMITGVCIANDTKDGERIVPEFTKYTDVPGAYKKLEFLAVANMFLPVIFDPRENGYGASRNVNYGTNSIYFGPEVDHYNGYISEIQQERRGKVTEIEMDAGYIRWTDKSGVPNDYKLNFAMLSAVGYSLFSDFMSVDSNDNETEYYKVLEESFTPFMILNSSCWAPMKLLGNGVNRPEALKIESGGSTTYDMGYYNGVTNRKIYHIMGDYYYRDYFRTPSLISGKIRTIPGISINYDILTSNNIISIMENGSHANTYRLYNGAEEPLDGNSFGYHNFSINHIESRETTLYGTNMDLVYSVFTLDDDEICKQSQMMKCYPYLSDYPIPVESGDEEYTGFIEACQYDYGHSYSGNNGMNGIPWNLDMTIHTYGILGEKLYNVPTDCIKGYANINVDTSGNITFSNPEYIERYTELDSPIARSRIKLDNYNGETYRGHIDRYGKYGQLPFNISDTNTDTNDIEYTFNNSQYRYLILGGYMHIEEYDGQLSQRNYRKFVWHDGNAWDASSEAEGVTTIPFNTDFGDIQNGVTVRNIKIYEYDSCFRRFGYSAVKRSNMGEACDDEALTLDSTDISDTIKFSNMISNQYNVSGGSPYENIQIDSRRLAHNYVPVEYVDTGDVKLDDVEKYGLYDTVEQIFIPINNNPLSNIGLLSGTNNAAKLIRAGGEIAHE